MPVMLGEGWIFWGGTIEHTHYPTRTHSPIAGFPHRCKTCGAIMPERYEYTVRVLKTEEDAKMDEMTLRLQELSEKLEQHLEKLGALNVRVDPWVGRT